TSVLDSPLQTPLSQNGRSATLVGPHAAGGGHGSSVLHCLRFFWLSASTLVQTTLPGGQLEPQHSPRRCVTMQSASVLHVPRPSTVDGVDGAALDSGETNVVELPSGAE